MTDNGPPPGWDFEEYLREYGEAELQNLDRYKADPDAGSDRIHDTILKAKAKKLN